MIKFIMGLFLKNDKQIDDEIKKLNPSFVILRKRTVSYYGLCGIKIEEIKIPYSMMNKVQLGKLHPGYKVYDYEWDEK